MADRPLNVWVVDDDQSVRWVLEKALSQADMESRSFERAEHLLEAIAHAEPDVLITDVRMPEISNKWGPFMAPTTTNRNGGITLPKESPFSLILSFTDVSTFSEEKSSILSRTPIRSFII